MRWCPGSHLSGACEEAVWGQTLQEMKKGAWRGSIYPGHNTTESPARERGSKEDTRPRRRPLCLFSISNLFSSLQFKPPTCRDCSFGKCSLLPGFAAARPTLSALQFAATSPELGNRRRWS